MERRGSIRLIGYHLVGGSILVPCLKRRWRMVKQNSQLFPLPSRLCRTVYTCAIAPCTQNTSRDTVPHCFGDQKFPNEDFRIYRFLLEGAGITYWFDFSNSVGCSISLTFDSLHLSSDSAVGVSSTSSVTLSLQLSRESAMEDL